MYTVSLCIWVWLLQLWAGECWELGWHPEIWHPGKCLWCEKVITHLQLGLWESIASVQECSLTVQHLISFGPRVSYEILGSITIVTVGGGGNDLTVNQWPHPNNHVLIISKAAFFIPANLQTKPVTLEQDYFFISNYSMKTVNSWIQPAFNADS